MNGWRTAAALLIACLGFVAASSPAAAGCCFLLTLDELPDQLAADRVQEISFRASLNDEIPIGNLEPDLRFEHQASGRTMAVRAVEAQEPGRYVAQFTLSAAGKWKWSIEVNGVDHAMPTLTVVGASAAPSPNANASPDLRTSLRWAGTALLLAAAGITAVGRRERTLAPQAAGG